MFTKWRRCSLTVHERGEIYDLVRDAKITGSRSCLATVPVSAGYAAARLPLAKFEPVGISFVGASTASPGTMEALEHNLRKDHPLSALYLVDRPDRVREAGPAGVKNDKLG